MISTTHIKQFLSHPLISGSTIIVTGTLIVNLLNYIFTLAMIRFLSESQYGVFASLISVINITFVFSTTILIVFTKFTATFDAQKKNYLIGTLLKKGIIWVGVLSFGLALIGVIVNPFIEKFLHLNNSFLLDIIIVSMFIYFVSSVPLGILQGQLKFLQSTIISIIATIIKLIFGVVLVYVLGLQVAGGLAAFLLAGIVGFVLSLFILRKFLQQKIHKKFIAPEKLKDEIIKYSIPVFFVSFSFTAFNSLDIILVRHFLSSNASGQYAVLSLMGRSIFFIIAPISSVLLPLVAQKIEKKEPVFQTLLMAMVLVLIPCVILTTAYFLIPKLILTVLLQSKAQAYLSIVPEMGAFALFITFYSLAYLLNSFYFSVGKTKVCYLALVAVFLEVGYIYLFHKSIMEIIIGLIAVTFLLLLSLLIYYRYAFRQE